jgi:hypothetical protein
VPLPVWLVAFVGVFPVYGVALALARHYWRAGDTSGRSWLAAPDRVVVAALIIVVAAVVAVLVSTVVTPYVEVPPGQPEVVDGRYVLNNHGTVTSVSREAYLHALETGQRGFVEIAWVFYVVAAAATGAVGTRVAARRRSTGRDSR